MADNAPIVRLDSQFLNEVELRTAEIALYQLADVVNWLVTKGAVYGQLVLPPEEAAMKRQAMQGGQNGSVSPA